MTELQNVPGYFPVSRDEAKQLIAPYLATDGYYLLRPTDGDAICTICVSNGQKLMNYRLFQDPVTRLFFVRDSKFPTISALIQHYQLFPLNEQVKTYLLYPVLQEQQEEYVALIPGPSTVTNPDNSRQPQTKGVKSGRLPNGKISTVNNDANSIAGLPGVHLNLAKTDVPIILQAYVGQDGSYLVRPSVSSNGQFTISLTCGESILNFKILTDQAEGKYFITPKKKCSSIRELLETHKTNPLRSKARPGAKVYLLHPIAVQDAQKILAQALALPPGWQEFYDERYKRAYYYNTKTGESVWERPKPAAAPAPLPPAPNKSQTMRFPNRPLPQTPQDITSTGRPKSFAMANENPPSSKLQPSARQSFDSGRAGMIPNGVRRSSDPPAELPSRSPRPREREPFPGAPQRELPSLPPKDSRSGSREKLQAPAMMPSRQAPPPPNKHGNEASRSDLPPLPSKNDTNHSSLPPLPPKTDVQPPAKADVPLPLLPMKNKSPSLHAKHNSNNSSFPPLPSKEEVPISKTSPLPDLPPKELKPSRTRPNEYADTVIVNTPPLPDKTPPTTTDAPPAPPPPPLLPAGVPAPPPPPPAIPPSESLIPRNTNKSAAPPKTEPPPSAAGGRPFSANDLARQKTLLKKKEIDEADLLPKPSSGGLQNMLSNALDQRLTSIRNAMTTSDDEDTDVEEIDEEDWDD